MKRLFLLFSHTLTDSQKRDAKVSLHVEEFVALTLELQELWSDIPEEKTEIKEYLKPLKEYLETYAKSGDFILIQGDFGGVYQMVDFAKSRGLIPIYSTTKREVSEVTLDDTVEKMSTFKHVLYRRY